jgi:hypothetical protein
MYVVYLSKVYIKCFWLNELFVEFRYASEVFSFSAVCRWLIVHVLCHWPIVSSQTHWEKESIVLIDVVYEWPSHKLSISNFRGISIKHVNIIWKTRAFRHYQEDDLAHEWSNSIKTPLLFFDKLLQFVNQSQDPVHSSLLPSP